MQQLKNNGQKATKKRLIAGHRVELRCRTERLRIGTNGTASARSRDDDVRPKRPSDRAPLGEGFRGPDLDLPIDFGGKLDAVERCCYSTAVNRIFHTCPHLNANIQSRPINFHPVDFSFQVPSGIFLKNSKRNTRVRNWNSRRNRQRRSKRIGQDCNCCGPQVISDVTNERLRSRKRITHSHQQFLFVVNKKLRQEQRTKKHPLTALRLCGPADNELGRRWPSSSSSSPEILTSVCNWPDVG